MTGLAFERAHIAHHGLVAMPAFHVHGVVFEEVFVHGRVGWIGDSPE
jgi:hypothetical protein